MELTLGFSPCPNDTFIFEALVNKKIDTEGLSFRVELQDIQTLNSWADKGLLDITKISFPAYFDNRHYYQMLDAGSALGRGVGPLLVAKTMVSLPDVPHCKIAIPGENTTANFLLSYALPAVVHKVPMLFSQIEDAVLNEEVDMGVLIHENRFTYQRKGLIKIMDLGAVWEQKQHAPIPLACIAAKSDLASDLQKRISNLIRKSVEYAFANYPKLTSFTIEHAQEMEEAVMRKHIELYVNEYSIDLGKEGTRAVEELLRVYEKLKMAKTH
ncbi:MAG: 1,4-dihydroxy-6-naphthoate synthase [Flavisolibacter sp.]